MRSKMEDKYEKFLSKANTMKEIAELNPIFQNKLIESIQPPIYLVREIFERQCLKDIPFETFNSVLEEEIETFWKAIYQIDETVTRDDSTKEHIKQKQRLKDFYDHCCTTRYYSFTIKKYRKDNYTIYKLS